MCLALQKHSFKETTKMEQNANRDNRPDRAHTDTCQMSCAVEAKEQQYLLTHSTYFQKRGERLRETIRKAGGNTTTSG